MMFLKEMVLISTTTTPATCNQ